MEAIKRQIYVLRDTLKDIIDYNIGTDMVPIEYHIMDFTVPATAAAVVYILKPDGKLDKILADVLDNVISFCPTKEFFAEGLNAIQIRIVDNNKALVSFTETVRAGKCMKFDDDTEAQQETLIEQLLTKIGELEEKINAGVLSAKTRSCDAEYVATLYRTCVDDEFNPNTNPAEMEGILIAPNGNIVVFINPLYRYGIDTLVEVVEINIKTERQPYVVRRITLSGLMHANSACILDNTIYVAKSEYINNNGDHVKVNTIAKIDYATFKAVGEITVNALEQVSKLASCDDKLYCFENGVLYSIDPADGSTYRIGAFDNLKLQSTQGIGVDGDNLYVCYTAPHSIVKYSISTGRMLEILNIPLYDGYGHHYEHLGDICFDKGFLYITPHCGGTPLQLQRYTSQWADYINYIARINSDTGALNGNTEIGFYSNKNIYVDTENKEEDIFITGTSYHPLRNISEALNNYFVKEANYNIVSENDITCNGVLKLISNNFKIGREITTWKLYGYDSKIADNITVTSKDKGIYLDMCDVGGELNSVGPATISNSIIRGFSRYEYEIEEKATIFETLPVNVQYSGRGFRGIYLGAIDNHVARFEKGSDVAPDIYNVSFKAGGYTYAVQFNRYITTDIKINTNLGDFTISPYMNKSVTFTTPDGIKLQNCFIVF
jgi:hypothetical protein